MSSKLQIVQIHGYPNCPQFEAAIKTAEAIKAANEDFEFSATKHDSQEAFHDHRKSILKKLNHNEDYHTTSPIIYTTIRNQPTQLIGGATDLLNVAKTEYEVGI